MFGMFNSIEYGIAHNHVGRCHINFCPQYPATIGVFSIPHFPKQLKVFVYAAGRKCISSAGLGRCTFLLCYFFGGTIIYISLILLNELFGILVQTVEIIRGIPLSGPLKAQPVYIFPNAVYVFSFFCNRIGIIKAQIGFSAIF